MGCRDRSPDPGHFPLALAMGKKENGPITERDMSEQEQKAFILWGGKGTNPVDRWGRPYAFPTSSHAATTEWPLPTAFFLAFPAGETAGLRSTEERPPRKRAFSRRHLASGPPRAR